MIHRNVKSKEPKARNQKQEVKGMVSMQKQKQISESLQLGIILALSGGFMDAYSYVCRGKVFANAQTGNILLCGVNLSEGNWQLALKYLCPILAFVLGLALTNMVQLHRKDKKVIHWRQITILFEAAVLLLVGFLPQSLNLLANSITSFACGIQVESFRKINGNVAATTMCIGNLRSATNAICEFLYTKEKKAALRGILYFTIICFFVIGAILGNVSVKLFQEKAIMISTLFLLIGFIMMFFYKEENIAMD